MMKIKSFLMLFVSVLAGATILVSCNKDEVDPVECTVSPTEIVLTSEKDASSSFGITFTNGEGQWRITKAPEFVSVYPQSGTGSGTIRVTTTSNNNQKNPSEGDIVIEISGANVKSQTVHVVQQNLTDCYVEPANILQMCEGLAYNWEFGRNVKYYYEKVYTQQTYNKMSENEIIKEVATGKVDDRIVPDNDNYRCFYNLNSNTQYVVVTISYAEGDRQGDVVITPLTTKSYSNQPEALVDDLSYYTDDSGDYYYGWNVKKNTYCREYYTYAAASPAYFMTYYRVENGIDAMVAWVLRNEIQKDGQDHTTSINVGYTNMPFNNGRDMFYASQVENGISYFTAFPYTDKYLTIITWGTSSSGELSGVLNTTWVDFTEDDSNAKSGRLLNVSTHKKSKGEPKSILVNSKDMKIVRINK